MHSHVAYGPTSTRGESVCIIEMNNEKLLSAMSAQVKSLTASVTMLMEHAGIIANTEAQVREVPEIAAMSVNGFTNDTGDPNIVRIPMTEGYMRNRFTLPREIFIKSHRDSYEHSEREVNDPTKSFVIVNGDKYYQTNNQGRSSKLWPAAFGVKHEGQTIILSRVKGNVWASSVTSGKGGHAKAVAKQASRGTVSLGNKSHAVHNPFAPKAKAQPASKATASTSFPQALSLAVQHVKTNAKAGFYNENVQNLNDRDYRVYLKREQHKAFKLAIKANGMTLAQGVAALAKACESK